MGRKKYNLANWKMQKTPSEAVSYVATFLKEVGDFGNIEWGIFPQFPVLERLARLAERTALKFGAQNVSSEWEGALTGEVSAKGLNEVLVTYALVGHSERRRFFSENDEILSSKLKQIWRGGLKPILCVGESLGEREEGRTLKILENQLRLVLDDFSEDFLKKEELVIAYEPVWAIGTGRTASVEQVAEAHEGIRDILKVRYGHSLSERISVLYGGSVKAESCGAMAALDAVDGFLVGTSALDVRSWLEIGRILQSAKG